MQNQDEQTIEARARELHEYIAEGKILEAMDEFYAEDVSMQDNLDEPCRGRAANIEREKAWLATVAEWKGFEVVAIAVTGNVSFAETTMDYVTTDGQAVHGEQVSRAVWRDGRIVDERFYHG